MQPDPSVRFNIEQARKQAKGLLRSLRVRDLGAAIRFRGAIRQLGALEDDEVFASKLAHHDALRVIAKEHGFPTWQALHARVVGGETPAYTSGQLISFFDAVWHLDPVAVGRALDEAPQLVHALFVYDELYYNEYEMEDTPFESYREALTGDPHPVSNNTRTALHLVADGFGGGWEARGESLLNEFAMPIRRDIAGILIERGADVNHLGWNGKEYCPPITLAVREFDERLARLLLKAGADVSGDHGASAAADAWFGSDVGVFTLLIEHGAQARRIETILNKTILNESWGLDLTA